MNNADKENTGQGCFITTATQVESDIDLMALLATDIKQEAIDCEFDINTDELFLGTISQHGNFSPDNSSDTLRHNGGLHQPIDVGISCKSEVVDCREENRPINEKQLPLYKQPMFRGTSSLQTDRDVYPVANGRAIQRDIEMEQIPVMPDQISSELCNDKNFFLNNRQNFHCTFLGKEEVTIQEGSRVHVSIEPEHGFSKLLQLDMMIGRNNGGFMSERQNSQNFEICEPTEDYEDSSIFENIDDLCRQQTAMAVVTNIVDETVGSTTMSRTSEGSVDRDTVVREAFGEDEEVKSMIPSYVCQLQGGHDLTEMSDLKKVAVDGDSVSCTDSDDGPQKDIGRDATIENSAVTPSKTGRHVFTCHCCGYCTNYKHKLNHHVKKHAGKVFYKCDSCSYKCNMLQYLRKHTQIFHKCKIEKCPYCHFYSNRADVLERHVKRHGKYQCKECDFRATTDIFLTSHVARCHPQVTWYRCDDCEFKTTRSSLLKLHRRIHACIVSPSSSTNECKFCDFTTDDAAALKQHKKMHSKFVCDLCQFSCRSARSFRRHMDSNHGEAELHKCPRCFYVSLNANNLSQHLKTSHRKVTRYRCGHCAAEFINLRPMQIHMMKNHKGLPRTYICQACEFTGASLKTMKKHIGEHPSSYSCSKCTFVTEKKVELNRHVLTHSSLECSQCKYKCSRTETMDAHIRRKHNFNQKNAADERRRKNVRKDGVTNETSIYQCDKCDYRSKLYRNFRVHRIKHSCVIFSCNQCAYTSPYKSALKRHSNVHSETKSSGKEKNQLCTVCGFTTSSIQCLKRHMEIHSGEKKHPCSHCNYRFYSASDLTVHMRTHTGVRPYACQYCSATYTRSCHLKSHEKIHQRAAEQFFCRVCSYATIYESSLKRHARIHTGNNTKKQERPFVCLLCNACYARNGDLDFHMKKHNSASSQVCSLCNATFTTALQYESHLRKHSDNYKFICALCMEPFMYARDYRTHMNKHSVHKLHICEHCNASFSASNLLNTHFLSHNPEGIINPFKCSLCDYSCVYSSKLKFHMETHSKDNSEFETDQTADTTVHCGDANVEDDMDKPVGTDPGEDES